MNKSITEFSPEAMDILVRHDWPGNVRELANVVERAMVVGKPPAIEPDDLPIQIEQLAAPAFGSSLSGMEKMHIQRVLDEQGWNITQAALALQIDRATLYNKIKKYGLRK